MIVSADSVRTRKLFASRLRGDGDQRSKKRVGPEVAASRSERCASPGVVFLRKIATTPFQGGAPWATHCSIRSYSATVKQPGAPNAPWQGMGPKVVGGMKPYGSVPDERARMRS